MCKDVGIVMPNKNPMKTLARWQKQNLHRHMICAYKLKECSYAYVCKCSTFATLFSWFLDIPAHLYILVHF